MQKLWLIGSILFTAAAGANCALGQLTDLHQFADAEFSFPQSTLVETSPGSFIGSYATGLFGITSSGSLIGTTSFATSHFDLAQWGALLPASNGYFYGVRLTPQGRGEIYRTLGASGPPTVVSANVGYPGPITEGSDGNIWGTQGTPTGSYSIYKMSLNGTVSTVAPGPGAQTAGPLLQASDGNFYGATLPATAAAAGEIYRVTPAGQYTLLYTFPPGEGSIGGIIEASNGLLYGTAVYQSAVCPGSVGGVFSLSLSGLFNWIYTIKGCYPSGSSFGPWGGVVQASDGYLYTTTLAEGTLGYGSIFRLGLDGSSVSSIASFTFQDGADPETAGPALTQGSDGILYGTGASGGARQGGVVFKVDLGLLPPLPAINLLQPQSGSVGTAVQFKGNYLLGVSEVSFNGVPAQFRAVNVNYIDAVVPSGATSGPITVTTMNGSYTTATDFTIQ